LFVLQMKLTRLAQDIVNRGMAKADERTKLESDLVTGIEAVKTQAWEGFFRGRVTDIRASELAILWQSFKLSALNTLVLQARPEPACACVCPTGTHECVWPRSWCCRQMLAAAAAAVLRVHGHDPAKRGAGLTCSLRMLQTVPTLVTIATFSAYVLLGNDLTAAKAFTSLSLFGVLRMPLFQLPMVVSQAVRASVAFRRLRVRPAPPALPFVGHIRLNH
jgi:hypothetical protein